MTEAAMLQEHGTKVFELKPGAIIGAAKADLAQKARKQRDEIDQATPYAFHRRHVGKAESPAALIGLAISDNGKGLESGKRNTRAIYSDLNLLAEAHKLALGWENTINGESDADAAVA